jgi:hypothetical protein
MAAYTTIDDPSAYFKVQLYTGNGSSGHAITFDDTDTNMQPDLVWIKCRNSTFDNRLFNSVRGVQKYLNSNSTIHEGSDSNSLTAFGSDGFTVGTWDHVNDSSDPYVAWCWKETADAGFDIVEFEGTGSARTISHSLSAVPHVMITKQLEDPGGGSNSWNVYHHKNTSAPETDYLILEDTSATTDSNIRWNDTAPTSSVFTVGTGNSVNQSGVDHIMFLWSEKQGFSKFGKYTGNGNADGPMIFLGLRPAFFMIKRTDSTASWVIFNNKTSPQNDASTEALWANSTSAEGAYTTVDFISNGVKIRDSSATINASGGTYVYMAFAEAPFVNSNGVPCNAR